MIGWDGIGGPWMEDPAWKSISGTARAAVRECLGESKGYVSKSRACGNEKYP
jgi:hypothetical protein